MKEETNWNVNYAMGSMRKRTPSCKTFRFLINDPPALSNAALTYFFDALNHEERENSSEYEKGYSSRIRATTMCAYPPLLLLHTREPFPR